MRGFEREILLFLKDVKFALNCNSNLLSGPIVLQRC